METSENLTCCSKSSKSFIKFLFTCIILMIVLLFSMFQLILKKDAENTAVYFSLISSIISLFIPPPQINHPEEHQPRV